MNDTQKKIIELIDANNFELAKYLAIGQNETIFYNQQTASIINIYQLEISSYEAMIANDNNISTIAINMLLIKGLKDKLNQIKLA